MNLIFLAHPFFLNQQSMIRFAKMLVTGMRERGHTVELWYPEANFSRLKLPRVHEKWFGYIDQYVFFPIEVRKRLKRCPPNTLFVFTDHALGPWVPLVSHRPHIIHCHDFLAQNSALGKIPLNPVKWSGRLYQTYIRHGYSKGTNFISDSIKTSEDLHQLLPTTPLHSSVTYVGLNQNFLPLDSTQSRNLISSAYAIELSRGYILHVGGNYWYKNKTGLIAIYNALRSQYTNYRLPLLMMGQSPDSELINAYNDSPFRSDIYFLTEVNDELLRNAYAGASLLLFPSHAEGFGWPVAEAMASGCPVVTTDEAPMTEVAGNAGFFIPRQPIDVSKKTEWAMAAANVVNQVLNLSTNERRNITNAGLTNSKRFDTNLFLNKTEETYYTVLQSYYQSKTKS